MTPRFSLSVLSGDVGVGFLVGVALHSLFPTTPVDVRLLSVVCALSILSVLTLWRRPTCRRALVFLIAFILGIWRFDAIRSTLPYGIVPLSAQSFVSAKIVSTTADPMDPRRYLIRVRSGLTEQANRTFSPDEAALLTGILYGERGLSPTVKDQFRRAGLMHIIAVSGSNVSVVVLLLMAALFAVGCSRRGAFLLCSVGLGAFVLFVGPSASVVRAAIMGWLVGLAPLVGRLVRPSRLLLVAAVLFVAWQPPSLLFDPGFALSFLAMLGLLTWTRLFDRLLRPYLPWPTIRSLITTTLGATLMTLPYTAWAFGQMSFFSLLTSLLALPLVPWAMFVGALALFVAIEPIRLAAQGFLDALLWVGALSDYAGFAIWSGTFSSMLMVSCYLMLGWLWSIFKKRLSTGDVRADGMLAITDTFLRQIPQQTSGDS